MKLDRRGFIMGALAFGGCSSVIRTGGSDGSYTVPILGDTHFDETEPGRYHVGWIPRTRNDRRDRKGEFARNSAMWKERLPSLIAAAAACRRPSDRFLLQLGDLIQGDCADAATETKMYRDAIAACRKGMDDLPFVTVAGNHDVRGVGRTPYDNFFPGFLSKELKRPVVSTTFDFREGPDAWIFADFMKPDVDRIFRAFDRHRGARYTFFVCHSPVTPVDNWGFYWFLFGKPEDTALRREFRNLLMDRHVIAICGHTHLTELNEWRKGRGLLTQFSANSVWKDPSQNVPQLLANDSSTWGQRYVEKHASDTPEDHDGHFTSRTRAESLALMAEYAADQSRYEKYNAAGHYRLNVSDAGVTVDYYGGASRAITKSFVLR